MSLVQKLIYHWIPSAEEHSRRWAFDCPKCHGVTSIHDLGGVRFQAWGRPWKWVRCQHCRWMGMAQITWRDEAVQLTQPGMETRPNPVPPVKQTPRDAEFKSSSSEPSIRLWIDGVGCWQVVTADELSIGGPSGSGGSHLSLLANLSRVHAMIRFRDEAWQLEPAGETTLNGKVVSDVAYLQDGDTIGLGSEVRLLFRVPSALGQTATLEFLSTHRPAHRIEGVLLLREHCQLGPGDGVHIHSPRWDRQIVVFRKQDRLCVRADAELLLNDQPLKASSPLTHGDVLAGPNWRMRIEVDAPRPAVK
jgi:hypothetical protein